MNPETKHRSGFVAIVGPTNAGKSTLLNAVLGRKVSIVSPKPQTTRNRIVGVKQTPAAELIYVDSPGFFEGRENRALAGFLRRSLQNAVDGVDAVLLVVDARELADRPGALAAMGRALQQAGITRVAAVALNKIDLLTREALLPVIASLQAVPPLADAAIIPISALRKEGLEQLEAMLIEVLPVAPRAYPEDFVTDQPEEFFIAEVIREKLFRRLEQELPYSTQVTVEETQERGELLEIRATIFVERESQKGMVIGKGGAMLKTVGSDAREELEQLLDTKIFLQLFVKVEAQWSRTEKGLRRAGVVDV